jgi:hypothetical protein
MSGFPTHCQRGNYPEIQDRSKRACHKKKLKKEIKKKKRWEELSKSIELVEVLAIGCLGFVLGFGFGLYCCKFCQKLA